MSGRPAADLSVVARGEAVAPERCGRAVAMRALVRWADPGSWLLVEALARAGLDALAGGRGERVAAVVVSPSGCPTAMDELARQAAEGYASPLRYPASAPSASLGVACIAFKLRGPTLCLAMSSAAGVPRAAWLAGRLLRRPGIDLAVVACARPEAARCIVVAGGAGAAGETEAALSWVRGAGAT